MKMQTTLVASLMASLCSGAAPLLLLPENIRIRKFNLQTEASHDFLEEEEEHIMALDYDWDHNNTGLSTFNHRVYQCCQDNNSYVPLALYVMRLCFCQV